MASQAAMDTARSDVTHHQSKATIVRGTITDAQTAGVTQASAIDEKVAVGVGVVIAIVVGLVEVAVVAEAGRLNGGQGTEKQDWPCQNCICQNFAMSESAIIFFAC